VVWESHHRGVWEAQIRLKPIRGWEEKRPQKGKKNRHLLMFKNMSLPLLGRYLKEYKSINNREI
jgi:hypothetical protein